ncbi:MAG: hypothetical protein JNL74_23470 [Fibrobacteres bacterium]|nr:hypothetical protein [Fibrobacterota bacterium]
MKKIFLGGSQKVASLPTDILRLLEKHISEGDIFILGDADGADKKFQEFLFTAGCHKVTVYCTNGEARYNKGMWPLQNVSLDRNKKDFKYYTEKDRIMAINADSGIMVWDGESKGTINNVLNLLEMRKTAVVANSLTGECCLISTTADLHALVSVVTEETKQLMEKKIKISRRIEAMDNEQIKMF